MKIMMDIVEKAFDKLSLIGVTRLRKEDLPVVISHG